jgi:hypothetical protein
MLRILMFLVGSTIALVSVTGCAAARPLVVELFTSEGCSSCPPADALLGELARRPDVLALSMHVTYWNGPAWTDTLASAAATERQYHYASLFGLSNVYTPQMVVDGREQVVGSNRGAVDTALAQAARQEADIPVTLVVADGRARVAVPGALGKTASVVLVGFDKREEASVRGGENGGRRLVYVDVVRGIETLGAFGGPPASFSASVPWHTDRLAALLQAPDGRVIGAAVADWR